MNITLVRLLKIFVMYCSKSFNPDELDEYIKAGDGEEIKFIGLPCSGKADLLYLVKSMEKGADGVVLLTCPENECLNIEGNRRAMVRADGVNEILEETGLGGERIKVISLGEDGLAGVAASISQYKKHIKANK